MSLISLKVLQTPDYLLGVINLRSNVVPVIDMRLKLGMKYVERSVDSSTIVMEVAVENEQVTVGALVDSVQEVIDLQGSQIEPSPRIDERLKTEDLRGMGHHNDRFIMILYIDEVSSEMNLLRDLSDEAV